MLIDAGSDVNARDDNGETPLHVSAGSGHLDVVRLLMEKGADLFAEDKEGRTPSTCAQLFGHKEVEKCLQERSSLSHKGISLSSDLKELKVF